jgi:hypothetical protein
MEMAGSVVCCAGIGRVVHALDLRVVSGGYLDGYF